MPKKKQAEEQTGGVKRNFKKQEKVYHDLFKLKAANCRKNVMYPESPEWVNVLHEHFYHSVDSNGLAQDHSSKIGGHFHKIEITTDSDGNMKATCGPALKEVAKKGGGKKIISDPNDNHTHECEYLFSEEMNRRKINADAQKVIGRQKLVEEGKISTHSVDRAYEQHAPHLSGQLKNE